MSVIVARIGNAGVERLIDWTIFTAGAASLVAALTLTVLSVLSPAPDFADNEATPTEAAGLL
jgi:hypothetical protein